MLGSGRSIAIGQAPVWGVDELRVRCEAISSHRPVEAGPIARPMIQDGGWYLQGHRGGFVLVEE